MFFLNNKILIKNKKKKRNHFILIIHASNSFNFRKCSKLLKQKFPGNNDYLETILILD